MKMTRHLCDLCGGVIKPKEPHATLTAPNFAKLDAEPKPVIDEMAFERVFFSMFSRGPAHDSQTYDICRGCVESLLVAKAWLREQQLAYERGRA